MACKAALMGDWTRYAAINAATNPSQAKELGRQVAPFQAALWDSRVCAVAFSVASAKAAANPTVMDTLRATGNNVIGEAAPRDLIWGIGWSETQRPAQNVSQWRGANVLGWAWMQVRQFARHVPSHPQERAKPRMHFAQDSQSKHAQPSASGASGTSTQPPSKRSKPSPSSTPQGKQRITSAPMESAKPQSDGGESLQLAVSPQGAVISTALTECGVRVPMEHVVQLSQLTHAMWSVACFCVIVTTLLEPLVLAHTDGDSMLVFLAEDHEAATDRYQWAESVCQSTVASPSTVLVPAGETIPHKAPVIMAPVPVAPTSEAVIRSDKERRRRARTAPGFFFVTMAALAGTSCYGVVAPALARANSFVRPAADIREATLAGAVLADAAQFHFGSRPVVSLVRDTIASTVIGGDKSSMCMEALGHEQDLQKVLAKFDGESITTPAVAEYVRESAMAVHFLDPEMVPEDLCTQASDFSDPELESLPFTHDCPVPVTEFQKLSPPQPESCNQCAATVQHCAEFILPSDECLGAVERWTTNAILDFERPARAAMVTKKNPGAVRARRLRSLSERITASDFGATGTGAIMTGAL